MTRIAQIRRDLKLSSREALFSSAMTGLCESFLASFALALGFGDSTAGMLAALPLLAGSVVQLASPSAIRRLGSFRLWIVACVILQAFCLLPLAYIAYQGSSSAFVLFGLVSLYWACGLSSSPAWTSWMSATIPGGCRRGYLAQRNRFAQIGLVTGLLLGGLILQAGDNAGHELKAFTVVFLLAGLMRFTSAYLLSCQSDRPKEAIQQKRLPIRVVLSKIRSGYDGRLLSFLMFFQVAVYLSSPFYSPFMLSKLQLSYAEFMVLVSAPYLSKIFVFPRLGRVAKKIGVNQMMRIAVLGTAFSPLTWILSDQFFYLLLTQLLSGFFWAMFDYSSVLSFFETLEDDERTGFLAIYNFLNASAVVFAGFIGAKVLDSFSASTFGYFVLFGASSVMRFTSFVVLERWVLPKSQESIIQLQSANQSNPPKENRLRKAAP